MKIKGADADDILIKGPRGSETTIINGADTADILIRGPQKNENDVNKESGRRGYTDQGPTTGGI